MRLLASLLLCSLAIACGQANENAASETQSVVLDYERSRWPNPDAIPVCITNRADVSDELFHDIKNHVTKEYADKTGLKFVGWTPCTTAQMSAKVIRITFRKKHNWSGSGGVVAGGGLSRIGMALTGCGTDCFGGTMRLDIGSSGNFPPPSSWSRNFAVKRTRATAVHEFGHAIGLMHEHEREDSKDCDRSDGSVVAESAPYVYVTDYDANSIMNYCHAGDQTTLSPKDVEGIAYLYP